MLLGEESKNKIYTLSPKQTIPIFANIVTVEQSDKLMIIHYENIHTCNSLEELPKIKISKMIN